MSVYVDASLYGYGRMVMCHMIADTPDELHAMADRIGVARRWFQAPPKASFWHYDIAKSKRALAVEAGANRVRPQRPRGGDAQDPRGGDVRPEPDARRTTVTPADLETKGATMDSKFLTYRGAADYLSVPVGTLRALVHRKAIPHVRIGPRSVIFERTELDRWIDELRV